MTEITNELEVKSDLKKDIKRFMIKYSVTILFAIICILGIIVSELPLFFIVNSLITRLTRNSFLVLALIIPVIAGMGLNFSIVIGAMAGQMAIIAVTHWGVTGVPGFILCAVVATPIAILFGGLTGRLLNKTRGQEMIASMISGFFANGIYQFIFLFALGGLIPFKNKVIVLSGGVGIRNTIDLSGGVKPTGIKYALDNILKLPFFNVMFVGLLVGLCYYGYQLYMVKQGKIHSVDKRKVIMSVVMCGLGFLFSSYMLFSPSLPKQLKMLTNLKLSVATAGVIFALCVFNTIIVRTKLGQDMRSVGHSQHIAQISGINVDKIRIIAITISMILAAWGQLIFLQNIGVLNTYGSHVQIGLFSVAALLIGGASVSKATVGQALLGVVLFHTLFIISPKAGQNLFGDAQIGEFFRAFVAYGVIGVALGLHAWKNIMANKNK